MKSLDGISYQIRIFYAEFHTGQKVFTIFHIRYGKIEKQFISSNNHFIQFSYLI